MILPEVFLFLRLFLTDILIVAVVFPRHLYFSPHMS